MGEFLWIFLEGITSGTRDNRVDFGGDLVLHPDLEICFHYFFTIKINRCGNPGIPVIF